MMGIGEESILTVDITIDEIFENYDLTPSERINLVKDRLKDCSQSYLFDIMARHIMKTHMQKQQIDAMHEIIGALVHEVQSIKDST